MLILRFSILVALGISFLCPLREAVVLSFTPSQVADLFVGPKESAAELKALVDRYNHMALVSGPDGTTPGLAALEDIVEGLGPTDPVRQGI